MTALRVVFGNRPQELLHALGVGLATFRREAGPFATPTILFGHSALREDALATLAAQNGVVANVATPTFDHFVAPLFAALGLRRLDRVAFEAGLLAVLAEADLPPAVRRYVGESPAHQERRRIELAARLAPLFEGYAQTRPDWIALLRALEFGSTVPLAGARTDRARDSNALDLRLFGKNIPDTSVAKWQLPLLGRVLSRLDSPRGEVEEPKPFRSLAELAIALRRAPESALAKALPKAIFFHAPGMVTEATRMLFAALGTRTQATVFAFNPCRELWDDLATSRSRAPARVFANDAREAVDDAVGSAEPGSNLKEPAAEVAPFELLTDDAGMPIFLERENEEQGFEWLDDEGLNRAENFAEGGDSSLLLPSSLFEDAADPALLVRWGRPLREQVRLWNEAVDGDFGDVFREVDAYAPSTLGALQRTLAERLPDEPGDPDASLRLFSVPSPAREAEVAASLLAVRAAEDRVPLDRLAVIVPPGREELYLPALRRAFAELGLPLRGYGVAAESVAQRIAAAQRLLAFPLGERTPAAVVALAREPALDFLGVSATGEDRFGETDAHALPSDELARLLDDAGIAYGHTAKDLAGTYLDPRLNTFSQGLDRLALGLFLPAGDLALDGFLRPIRPLAAEAAPAVARVAVLLAEADRFAQRRAPLARWGADLAAWVRGYFLETSEFDVSASAVVSEALAGLKDLDVDGAEYTYTSVVRLAESALSRVATTTRVGAPGVLCGPLPAFRALPLHAAVFLGFGEGVFPERVSEDPHDLRRSERRAGDLLPEDRDRAAFLELLCAVEGNVYLAWNSVDGTSGDEKEPSGLVHDLAAALSPAWQSEVLEEIAPYAFVSAQRSAGSENTFGSERAAESVEKHVSYTDVSPEAQRSRRARLLGEELRRVRHGDLPLALHRVLPPETAFVEAIRAVVPVPKFQESSGNSAVSTTGARSSRISVADLIAYLRCPVQGAARARLRLHLEGDKDDGRDGEPLDFDDYLLDNLAVDTLFAGDGDIARTEALFRARVAAAKVGARLPSAPFAEARITAATGTLAVLVDRFRRGYSPLFFASLGPMARKNEGRVVCNMQQVGAHTLVGALPPLVDDAIVIAGRSAKDPNRIVEGLSAYRLAELMVARAVLVGCLSQPVNAVRVLAVGESLEDLSGRHERQELPELTPEDALENLERWVAAAVAPIVPRYAPLEAFVEGHRFARGFEGHRDGAGAPGQRLPYAAVGAVPGWRDWPVPDDEGLLREAQLRLGFYEELLRQKPPELEFGARGSAQFKGASGR